AAVARIVVAERDAVVPVRALGAGRVLERVAVFARLEEAVAARRVQAEVGAGVAVVLVAVVALLAKVGRAIAARGQGAFGDEEAMDAWVVDVRRGVEREHGARTGSG